MHRNNVIYMRKINAGSLIPKFLRKKTILQSNIFSNLSLWNLIRIIYHLDTTSTNTLKISHCKIKDLMLVVIKFMYFSRGLFFS
jgi:hypothetical protein